MTVQNLQPGATYYFALATAKKRIATGTFSRTADGVAIALPAGDSRHPGKPCPPPNPLQRLPPRRRLPRLRPAPGSAFPISSNARRRQRQSMRRPAGVTWGHPSSLPDHFARHGADFGARDPGGLRAHGPGSWGSARSPNICPRRWMKRACAVSSIRSPARSPPTIRTGTTKTFFKPGNPGYFDRQPGRLIFSLNPWLICVPHAAGRISTKPPRSASGGGSLRNLSELRFSTRSDGRGRRGTRPLNGARPGARRECLGRATAFPGRRIGTPARNCKGSPAKNSSRSGSADGFAAFVAVRQYHAESDENGIP